MAILKTRAAAIVSSLALIAAIVGCAGCSGTSATQEGSSTDESSSAAATSSGDSSASYTQIKSFTAQVLGGGTYTQDDLAATDVTVFNFWTSHCPTCVEEMPELAELERALPSNVRLVTVFLEGPLLVSKATPVLEDAGFTGTTLVSYDGDFEAVADSVMYTPTTMVFSSDGALITKQVGAPDDVREDYLALINSCLELLGKPGITLED